MKPVLTLGIALLASTALAQQMQQGVEDPSARMIQGSTVIPDTTELPGIEPGEQAVEVETAAPRVEKPRTAADGSAEPAGAELSTKKVKEMVEDTQVDPETGDIEASVGGAEPDESWVSGMPCDERQADPCPEPGNQTDTNFSDRQGVDTTAVRNGGDGSTVRPPAPGNDAVDNLTTGAPAAPPKANEPGNLTATVPSETTRPERPQELENEPQRVLTEEGGKIDLEADARVTPESATVAEPGSGG